NAVELPGVSPVAVGGPASFLRARRLATGWPTGRPDPAAGSPRSQNPLEKSRHGLGERHRRRGGLRDPLQVSVRALELLDQTLGVPLLAGLAGLAQVVLRIALGTLRRVLEGRHLLLEAAEQREHLLAVLRGRGVHGRRADDHVPPGDVAG